jgi:hypothetical protein
MQHSLGRDELKLMRQIAARGSLHTAGTAENRRTLTALQKRGFVANNALTKKGWKALREVDDDSWSD